MAEKEQKTEVADTKYSIEWETFSCRGPLHLTDVDWDNEHHRRSVAASLTTGVYIFERDRQENRDPSQALAPPWFEFFHFQLIKTLIDEADNSIFGAIYEYNPTSQSQPSKNTPHFVIAFRGTLTKRESLSRDLKLDLHILRQGLHKTTRAQLGVQAVRSVFEANSQNRTIWLSGHSLGAAMANLAGREMVINNKIYLETFLFNPPFCSMPIERIKSERVKHGVRLAGSVITAGLAFAMTPKEKNDQNNPLSRFSALSSWIPKLYVHPDDHICSEYIGYFRHREKMQNIGAGKIENLATQHSIGSVIMTAIGKEAEPLHLIPSASLTVNLAPSLSLKKAHALRQWWQPESQSRLCDLWVPPVAEPRTYFRIGVGEQLKNYCQSSIRPTKICKVTRNRPQVLSEFEGSLS